MFTWGGKSGCVVGQITTGIRLMLSNPIIYNGFQKLLGSDERNKAFVKEFVRARPGDKILDIGCGTAKIIDYLPDVDYWGFDPHHAYINRAKRTYGNARRFFCKELSLEDLDVLPAFDIVLVLRVLHHLDDKVASKLLRLAHQALKPSGRLITIDPCFTAGQNSLARLLISWDRGQNVRSREGYITLVSRVFSESRVEIRHRSWIPYTHCFMECTRK